MVQKFTDTEACICQWMCLLNSLLGASHLVDYISVHIRFDLERYLLNIVVGLDEYLLNINDISAPKRDVLTHQYRNICCSIDVYVFSTGL